MVPASKLSTVRRLGSGGYGEVTLVRDTSSHRLYAFKRTRKGRVLCKNGVRRCAWIWREKALLEALDHPFVVTRSHGHRTLLPRPSNAQRPLLPCTHRHALRDAARDAYVCSALWSPLMGSNG
jgi:serine/threonine protein kinase